MITINQPEFEAGAAPISKEQELQPTRNGKVTILLKKPDVDSMKASRHQTRPEFENHPTRMAKAAD